MLSFETQRFWFNSAMTDSCFFDFYSKNYDKYFTTRAGFPAAKQLSGTSFVTTDPAAITEPVPIDTPFKIVTFAPIQTLSPMDTGLVEYCGLND